MYRFIATALSLLGMIAAASALTPEEIAKLPAPATREVDFTKDIQPLFEASCVKCHAKGKAKGGLSLETRETFLKGGDTGPAAEPGKSAESLIVEMVSGTDPDSVMPKKGKRWTPEEVGLLRAWIDHGMPWPADVTFARPAPRNLFARGVGIAVSPETNPVDAILASYFREHKIEEAEPVNDSVFARRVYLDAVGLLPTPEQLDAFLSDGSRDKRTKLVRRLLADRKGYADHWLTFWNDLLRNDYKGTGFIDGGRKQISEWLYDALIENKPYNQFVAELVNPSDKTEGFTSGIRWRGTVSAVMQPPMQAAQSVSQVFLGINLKCASCHDSFVSDWSLEDAYGMAAIFSDGPLELVHCDKPTGQQAALRFLYPQLGTLDTSAARPERLQRFAEILTNPRDGRLTRTVVNRLWARLFGRGLVEPLDDMEQPAWNSVLLDFLADDFSSTSQHYDVKQLLELIITSRAYQMPSVETPGEKENYVFRGPLMRRLNAEEFSDAISALTGHWAALPSSLEFDLSAENSMGSFQMPRWIWTDEPLALGGWRWATRQAKAKAEAAQAAAVEAAKLAEVNSPEAVEATKAAAIAADEAAQAAKTAEVAIEKPLRHKVIFRRHVTLAAAPDTAFATIIASQSFELRINGQEVKSKLSDDLYLGRVRLFDARPFLQAGRNLIAVSVDSHTEKGLSEIERQKYPASTMHLNQVSGMAFYLRCRNGDSFTEWTSDDQWHVRRSPDGTWYDPDLAETGWVAAKPLPEGAAPIDEGPGLEPITRNDFANKPSILGRALRPASSVAALASSVRASLRAADPLQVALDRPNREIVTPSRQTTPTTLQGLELTNGATLNSALERAGGELAKAAAANPGDWVDHIYRHALSRSPSAAEREAILPVLSTPVRPDGVADFLWALTMLPEFQFIN